MDDSLQRSPLCGVPVGSGGISYHQDLPESFGESSPVSSGSWSHVSMNQSLWDKMRKKKKMYIQVIIKYQFFYAQYLFAKKKGAILTRLWGKIWCVGSREVTLCSPTVGASPCAQGIMKISVPEFVTHLKGRQTNRCHFLRHNGESFCVRTQIGLHEPENGTIST